MQQLFDSQTPRALCFKLKRESAVIIQSLKLGEVVALNTIHTVTRSEYFYSSRNAKYRYCIHKGTIQFALSADASHSRNIYNIDSHSLIYIIQLSIISLRADGFFSSTTLYTLRVWLSRPCETNESICYRTVR